MRITEHVNHDSGDKEENNGSSCGLNGNGGGTGDENGDVNHQQVTLRSYFQRYEVSTSNMMCVAMEPETPREMHSNKTHNLNSM